MSHKTELSLLELKDENFVFFSERTKNKISTYFETYGFTPKSVLKPNDNSMVVVGFVLAGLGISIVPYSSVLQTEGISIIQVKEQPCYRTIYLGWKKNTELSSPSKLFKDFLIDFMAKIDCKSAS